MIGLNVYMYDYQLHHLERQHEWHCTTLGPSLPDCPGQESGRQSLYPALKV